MTEKIPDKLKNEEFRFVLLGKYDDYFKNPQTGEFQLDDDGEPKSKGKAPIEKKWTTENNYKFNDPKLLNWINQGGNYGVLGGPGNLVILDIDNMDYLPKFDEILPETFEVETGSGKRHRYYITESPEKIILDDPNEQDTEKAHLGEFQGPGAQCVGPGSIHPKSKNEYKVLKDVPIARLDSSIIQKLKESYSKRTFTVQASPDWNTHRRTPVGDQIPITSVIDITGFKKTPSGEYYGVHPIHGSKTGMNFFVNPDKNMWHCFRHDSGGDSIAWLAIKEGICDCSDFGPGGSKLKGKDFIDVLKVAKRDYGVKVEEIVVDKMANSLEELKITTQMLDALDVSGLEVVRADHVKDLEVKKAEWIIEGEMLAENSLTLFAGRSGAYKSITSLHMAHCIAEGKKVFGRYATKQCNVLYVNEENTWSIFKPMVQMIQDGLQTTGNERLFFCTYQNLSLDMNNAEGRTKLERVIRDKNIKVLFIDALKRVINFDENDANRVNEFYNGILKPLIAKYGLTVVPLHHTRKEIASSKYRVDKKDLIRGSSDFVNIADGILYFEKSPKNLLFSLHQIKNRLAEEFTTKTIKIIADKQAGFAFEELTTEAEDDSHILRNACAMDILEHAVKHSLNKFKSSYIKTVLTDRYGKTAIHSGLTTLVVQEILKKTTVRGEYEINEESDLFKDIKSKVLMTQLEEAEEQTQEENESQQTPPADEQQDGQDRQTNLA